MRSCIWAQGIPEAVRKHFISYLKSNFLSFFYFKCSTDHKAPPFSVWFRGAEALSAVCQATLQITQ